MILCIYLQGGRGRSLPPIWVFGMVDTSHVPALEMVDSRDAATLFPIISNHILRGTVLWSDKWAAYKAIIVGFLFPVTLLHCNFRTVCIFIITFDDHVIKIFVVAAMHVVEHLCGRIIGMMTSVMLYY